MWRDQVGTLEMFLAYFNECKGLTSWNCHRDLMYDLILQHETAKKTKESELEEPSVCLSRQAVPQDLSREDGGAFQLEAVKVEATSEVDPVSEHGFDEGTSGQNSYHLSTTVKEEIQDDQTEEASRTLETAALETIITPESTSRFYSRISELSEQLSRQSSDMSTSCPTPACPPDIAALQSPAPGAPFPPLLAPRRPGQALDAPPPFPANCGPEAGLCLPSTSWMVRAGVPDVAKEKPPASTGLGSDQFRGFAQTVAQATAILRRGSSVKSFSCSVCSKRFSSQARRLQHEWMHSAKKAFACSVCEKSFISNTLRMAHERSHADAQCASGRKTHALTDVEALKLALESGQQDAQVMAKMANAEALKVAHERGHGDAPAVSGGRLYSPAAGQHLAIERPQVTLAPSPFHERPFVCQEAQVHGLQKSFSCSFCPKIFSYYHSKLRHERIHTDERPFPCTFCAKRFRESSSRIRHERIHTGERPYPCDFCPKAFVEKMAKVRHERVHRPVRTMVDKRI